MPNAVGQRTGALTHKFLKELGILSPLTFDAFLKAIYLSRDCLDDSFIHLYLDYRA